MRLVEEIRAVDKKKKRVMLDDGTSLPLYNSEIRKFQLEEGMELPDELYAEILQTVLLKRGRLRLLNLLKTKDYTEKQLREKLRMSYYPEEVIEDAIAYVISYHYVDDYRYARQYAQSREASMSRRLLENKLREKGISEDIRRKVMEEFPDDELSVLDRLIRKKNIDFSGISREERQKIYAYFMRKGFSCENILKKINEFESSDYLT